MFLPVGSVFLDVNSVCSAIAIIAMMFFLSGSFQNIFLVNVDPSSVEARLNHNMSKLIILTIILFRWKVKVHTRISIVKIQTQQFRSDEEINVKIKSTTHY